MAIWSKMCRDFYETPTKINWRESHLPNTPLTFNYLMPTFLKNQISVNKYFERNNITHRDIVFYSDGSFKDYKSRYNRRAAGIGIYIEYNNKCYYFSQAIGVQSILFSEQYIIAIFPEICKAIGIPYNDRRVFGFTDSQITYINTYKIPQHPAYIDILTKIRENITDHKKFWLNKVAAHLDRIDKSLEIIGNSEADKLANYARAISNKYTIPTPWFGDWDFSKLEWRYLDAPALTVVWNTYPIDTG